MNGYEVAVRGASAFRNVLYVLVLFARLVMYALYNTAACKLQIPQRPEKLWFSNRLGSYKLTTRPAYLGILL